MNTLEHIYKILIESDLARGGEDFSINWAGKHRGWFAHQVCKHRDFSTDVAFNTLRKTRSFKQQLLPKRKQLGFLVEDNIVALEQIEHLLCTHLFEKYKIIQ